MAVATTGAIYKSLSFDGMESRNFGVYITGEAVYNAPARDVEMVSIPGRSGAFALDKGRFENIEVTYPAGIFADNEADFANAVSDFRNYLCSRKGYCRLVDEYNPEEYRMAIYKGGLEVTPAQLKAGEFNIVFDCKPQRYLMSGEAAVDVSDGDTLLNPTMFESSPLLEVEGYGTISFNGYAIEIENGVMGEVVLSEDGTYKRQEEYKFEIPSNMFQSGDLITLSGLTSAEEAYNRNLSSSHPGSYSALPTVTNTLTGASSEWVTAPVGTTPQGQAYYLTYYVILIKLPDLAFVYGTDQTYQNTTTITGNTFVSGGGTDTVTVTSIINVVYYAASQTISITRSTSYTVSGGVFTVSFYNYTPNSIQRHGRLTGNSTVYIMGHPTYLDCDLGEAYKIEGDEFISLNKHIDLGSDLPKFASGSNVISFDDTITDLKIYPRWWKV